ncbi:MAG: hypothetical protein FJX40_00580 [Alphaproteobacteria bacterium]|jgi:hypothetical protein|nr:hypothetical protein [Alphaproteobacteria bacterium]MBM3625876.1 hypothetical protein [Alphaproteobacteria bacterium]MBM3639865.1 hypothetical protein [Alphaproteobacteria bacterium]
MMRRTLVFFVCSPHSRTGVTTAARLLTDYYLSRNVRVEGFDTASREPLYALFFPERTRVVDLDEVKGQISLFDSLLVADERPKIVDVWHRSYERLFATIAEIGFLEEARRLDVEPIVLFQTDVTESAANSALVLKTTWPDLTMSVIHNRGASPLGRNALTILARYPTSGKFVIPRLEAPMARALDDVELSLSRFMSEPPPGMSLVVRAALKAWLLPIFTQFQSFELRLELQSSEFLR